MNRLAIFPRRCAPPLFLGGAATSLGGAAASLGGAAVMLAMLFWTATAQAGGPPVSIGGAEGEVDLSAHFSGMFGDVQPSERESTWQSANVKLLSLSGGYSFGKIDPLENVYLQLGGTYFTAEEERVERADDDLPQGHLLAESDRGAVLHASVFADLVHEARFSFGLYLQGSVPLDVDLNKFSSLRVHWVGGGSVLNVFVSEPTNLVRLRYRSEMFIGSGAYADEGQHNAEVILDNQLILEAARWALPWRMGIGVGPHLAADLNEHVNVSYARAYAQVSPDLVAGERVRAVTFGLQIQPYFRVTEHVAFELGFRQQLFGYDARATQVWSGALRTAF